MARKSVTELKAKAKAKTSKGKTTDYLTAIKHMGDEPIVSPLVEITGADFSRYMSWYNNVLTISDSREYTEAYLRKVNRDDDASRLKKVPDTWYPIHIGWIARLVLRGAKLPKSYLEAFDRRLSEAFTHIPVEHKRVEANKPKNDLSERVGDIIFALDKMTDELGHNTFSVFEWLKKNEIPTSLIPHVIKHYEPIQEEIVSANSARVAGSKLASEDLKEGYSRYTKEEMKQMTLHYMKLLLDLNTYIDNKKKERKPRKKKAIDPTKVLKNFKYQKESKEYQLSSVNPVKMFDSSEVWLYNTKYKILTVLRKKDLNFTVSGSSIKNYDETQSFSYRLGRKAEKFIQEFNQAGKRSILKMISDLKYATLNPRSNEHTIILRTF